MTDAFDARVENMKDAFFQVAGIAPSQPISGYDTVVFVNAAMSAMMEVIEHVQKQQPSMAAELIEAVRDNLNRIERSTDRAGAA